MVDVSESKHEIAQELSKGKQQGRYRDCTHLSIGFTGASYLVACANDSLQNPPIYNVNGMPPSCPKDCSFFEDQTAAKMAARRAERRARTWRLLQYPFRAFRNLAEKVQIAIIAAIVVIVLAIKAPQVIPLLIDLVKAFRG